MPKPGTGLRILFDLPEKANICKINFFKSPEIKEMNDDGDCESEKGEKKARVDKLHCRQRYSEFLKNTHSKKGKIVFNRIFLVKFFEVLG